LLRLDLASGSSRSSTPLAMLPGGRQGGYSIYDVARGLAEQTST